MGDATRPFYMGEYKPLTDAELISVAIRFNLPESRVRAIFEIESAGRGSEKSGALRHLYEPHVMWRNLKSGSNLQVRNALSKKGLAYARWQTGKYPKTPYARTDKIIDIIEDMHPQGLPAAVELTAIACSWGLGQILGENAKLCGYDSATDMVEKFSKSEFAQLVGMMKFIEGAGLSDDLRKGRWVAFAEGYNGKLQARHNYSGRLAAADRKWAARIATRGPLEELLEIPADKDPSEWVWERDTNQGELVVDTLPQPIPDPVIGDLSLIERHILANLPNIDPIALDTIKGLLIMRDYERGNSLKIINPETPPLAGKAYEMSSIKKWWESKGVNGGITAVISMVLMLTGYDVPVEAITELGSKLVEIVGLIGAVVAIYGRVVADSKIS